MTMPLPLPVPDDPAGDEAPLTNAELVQLRIRVIALENLVVALLSEASERQAALVQEMARYISPRSGCTPHPVTLGAAEAMRSLVGRADRYCRPAQR